MNILIRNGTLINPENSIKADLFISNGVIKHIGTDSQLNETIDKEIDANGCYVFPGAVDPHVHLNLPTPFGFSSDDFYSGTRAALFGGTTSIIDFVTPRRGQSIYEAFHERKYEARHSLVDYKLHVSPVEWVSGTEADIERCFKEEHVRSFKVYMAYKSNIGINEGAMLQVMKTVGRLGGIVTLHCEMGNEIEVLRDNFAQSGKLSVDYHPLSRPARLEAMAVKRAIDIAATAECPIYIVHVSSAESITHIRKAQARMQTVFAETCPQYLLLNDSIYLEGFEKAAAAVISPPLRKDEDNQALWQAVADGTIQTVGTDHCPFWLEQKQSGMMDFRKIPNGAGGIEHRIELLYTYGVLQNKISINRFVELVSTQPAKIFGLYPRKGKIALGSDADVVVWDPLVSKKISVDNHQQNCDLNIYDGFDIHGIAREVIAGGNLVIENGHMIHHPKGLYLL